MDRLRWGIIGAGRFGRVHARAVQALPELELAAICRRDASQLAEIAEQLGVRRAYTDYRELVASPELDGVSICTHWREHCEIALAALAAGKHVLLEKPMAATPDECARLLEAALHARGYLLVGHICRFDPRVTLAKRAIEAGQIGRILSMHAKRNLPVAPGSLRLDKISPLMGDGIHDADLMMWFTGRAPSRVYARNLRAEQFTYPDIGWAVLEFGDQAIGVIETNWRLPANTPTAVDARFEIAGTDGQVTIDCGSTGLTVLTAAGTRQPDTMYWPVQHERLVGALVHELSYFADCIRRRVPPTVVTPREAACAVAVMARCEESATAGVPLPFDVDAWSG
ncbi:MAG: Gfo/Idh/MocA family protein [Pirellulaceae bacterium]